MKQQIKTLVTSGKLQIGPWFLLPDEYPVDGEVLVCNLLWGNRNAKELGGVFNVGYTSFGWGQITHVSPVPVQTRKHTGSLPAGEKSLFEIDNANLRFSTLKKAEDRNTFIVRLYNPTDKQQKGNLKFVVPLTSAWRTNLNEEHENEIRLTDKNLVLITADPQKIITVEIKPI